MLQKHRSCVPCWSEARPVHLFSVREQHPAHEKPSNSLPASAFLTIHHRQQLVHYMSAQQPEETSHPFTGMA